METPMHDTPDTPCKICGDEFDTRRAALGYFVCLPCGERAAKQVTYCSAPINKSNYMLITNRAQLAQLNPKRTA